jgi:hypothetical protein
MIQRPYFIIISGNGRNTGKTSFVCRVITTIGSSYSVTAIKVSPHFHPERSGDDILFRNEHFIIRKELSTKKPKDSSLMLAAGAANVYYIEAIDSHLPEAINTLFRKVRIEGPVICESGGMRRIIEPSIFLLLNKTDNTEEKAGFTELKPMADRIITFNGEKFDLRPENISFDGEKWCIG